MNTYKIATKVLDLDPLTKEEEKEIRIKKNEILKNMGKILRSRIIGQNLCSPT